jgi:hypothetical protein
MDPVVKNSYENLKIVTNLAHQNLSKRLLEKVVAPWVRRPKTICGDTIQKQNVINWMEIILEQVNAWEKLEVPTVGNVVV